MQLSSTKLLVTSCCDKLLTRNSSMVANQHLFTSTKLSPNRSGGQLVTFASSGFGLRASSCLFGNGKLSVQNGDSKPHYYNSKVNSINCRRHLNRNLNLKQQFVAIDSGGREVDFKKNKLNDKRILKLVKCKNEFEVNKLNKRVKSRVHESYGNLNRLKFDKSKFNNLKISVNNSISSSSSDQILTGLHSNHQQASSTYQANTNDSVITSQQDYTDLINVRSIYRNNLLNQSDQGDQTKMSGIPFKPKKALILTKFSRLEYERRRLAGCTEDEVKDNLIRRGSDYESLLNHHNIHTSSKEHVAKTLNEFGIEYRIVNRFEYNQEQIDWADVIITTGGDGTFLMAASKIFNKDKLVIGINSDPSRSVGYLCLQPNYSINFKSALEKLASGDFRWVYRQRIRVSVKGENAQDAPAELHDQQLLHPEFRYLDLETHPLNRRSNSPHRPDNFEYDYQILPVRALNDVFVGECLSSRVSYFELKIEDKQFVKVKSSGVTICTGTGSTSWSFNINKISPQSVSTLFKIINEETNANLDATNEQLTKSITKKFNDSLIFDVCRNSMAYTVRDPVYMGNGFDSDNRGFAKNIVVKSRMFDACVVIDGGLSYRFNDGAYAKFELLDEDQLKTVTF